nr:hypothetical protein [Deefgea sp. CFH1-16]
MRSSSLLHGIFTPNGRSIQAKGITPDIIVEDATLNGKEDFGLRLRESDLGKHLDNPSDKDAGKTEATPAVVKTEIKKPAKLNASGIDPDENPRELVSKSDFQLQQALNVLKVQQLMLNKDKPGAKKIIRAQQKATHSSGFFSSIRSITQRI